MAADILLYKATHVPVGADQKQHLELTRDIAQKFNNDFNCKGFFPLPEPLIPKNISRVMSLRDGTKKMSKSEDSDYSRINLKDSADEIIKKIKKAKSDSDSIPDDLKSLNDKPEAFNLLNIYSEISKNSLEKVLNQASKNIFIPFAVGGGIRSIEDASRMFSNGADKIAINSAGVPDSPKVSCVATNSIGVGYFVASKPAILSPKPPM